MNRKLHSVDRVPGIRAAIRYIGFHKARAALASPLPVIGRDIPVRFTPKPVDPRDKPIYG